MRHPNRDTRNPRNPRNPRKLRAGHAHGAAATPHPVVVRLPDGRAFKVAADKAARFLAKMAGKAATKAKRPSRRSPMPNQWNHWPHAE